MIALYKGKNRIRKRQVPQEAMEKEHDVYVKVLDLKETI